MDGDTVPTDELVDAEDEGESGQAKKFGETATLSGGATVTVTAPEAFEMTAEEQEDYVFEVSGPMARFEVTVTNNSSEPLNMPPWISVLADGKEASSVMATESLVSLDEEPSVTLLPGKTASWRSGWYIDNPSGDITVQLDFPGLDYGIASVYFTN